MALRAGLLFGFWAALVLAAVGLDAVLHAYDVVSVGLWLGGLSEQVSSFSHLRTPFERASALILDCPAGAYMEDLDTKERINVVPGALRKRDVTVGRHVAISTGAVPRFLDRFSHATLLESTAKSLPPSLYGHWFWRREACNVGTWFSQGEKSTHEKDHQHQPGSLQPRL